MSLFATSAYSGVPTWTVFTARPASVLGNLGRIVKGHGTALPVHLDVVLVEGQFPLLGYGIFLQGNGAQPFAQFLHHLPLQVPPAPHGGMIPPPWAGTAVIGKKGGCRAHDPEVP